MPVSVHDTFKRAAKRKKARALAALKAANPGRKKRTKFGSTKVRPGYRHHARATTIAKRLAEQMPHLNRPQQPTGVESELDLLPGKQDGRAYLTRRMRQHLHEIVTDLGGEDMCCHNQMVTARRAAAVAVICEQQEDFWMANDKRFSLDDYIKLARLQKELGNTLGMKRIARPVGPGAKAANLRQYLDLTANGKA